MTFDEVMRFVHAAQHALGKAGVDNRVAPLIELAYADWQAFKERAEREQYFVGVLDVTQRPPLEGIAEISIRGCIIRPKADTIPASVAFGAALTALPKLSHAAGCYTGIHVTALTGIDPRAKP